MASTTLDGVLLKGVAASRPAANAVAKGTIYSATDTGAITQSDGVSTWSTYATISSGLTDPMTTRGDVIVRNASNVTARLAIGSTGKVLSSDGTDVSWQTPSSAAGALVFLEAHTASASATLNFTTFISATYDTYVFKFVTIVPATSTAILYMRMSTDGGSTYDAGTTYGYQIFRHSYNASAVSGFDSGTNQIALTTAWLSAGNHPIAGSLELNDPGSTSWFKWVSGKFVYPDSAISNMAVSEMGGQYNNATAVNAVRFLMSSGNITSGTIRVYGVTKS